MRKIVLPPDVAEEAIELYESVLDQHQEDSVAIAKIQQLLVDNNITCSQRTIYKLIDEWKKSGSVKSIVEAYDVDLSIPYGRTEYILDVLSDELKKSVENNEPANKKIRIADAMHKYIETEIKIQVLRSKKTTTSQDIGQSTSKIVLES